MDLSAHDLKRLRRFEFFFINTLSVVIFCLYFVLTNTLTFGYLYLLLAILFIVLGAISVVYKVPFSIYYLHPSLRKLQQYENEKLGQEWENRRQGYTVGYFLLAAVFLLNAYQRWDSIMEIDWIIVIPILPLALLISNVFLFYRKYRIDKSTKEGLEGFVAEEIILGVIMLFLIIGVTYYIIIF